MMVRCCVPFCNSRSSKGIKYNMYEFPSNVEVRNKWIIAISRTVPGHPTKLWEPSPSGRDLVCSIHFNESDFKEGLKIRRLKPGTVPTIFPHYYPRYKVKEEKKESPSNIDENSNGQVCYESLNNQLTPYSENGITNIESGAVTIRPCTSFIQPSARRLLSRKRAEISKLKKKIQKLEAKIQESDNLLKDPIINTVISLQRKAEEGDHASIFLLELIKAQDEETSLV